MSKKPGAVQGSLRYYSYWTPDSKALLFTIGIGSGSWLARVDVETSRVDTLAGPLACDWHIHKNAYGDITFLVQRQVRTLDFRTGGMKTTPYAEARFLNPKTGRVEIAYDYYSKERPLSGDIRIEQDFRAKKVWIVEGDGVTRHEFPYRVLLQRLSPTRDTIAFITGDGNLYVSRLDGSARASVGRGSSWNWSLDGKRLAFVGAIEESEYTVLADEIFIANADGAGITQLTYTPDVIEEFPVWSPDGTRIAYVADRTGKIYVAVLEEVK